MSIEYEIGRAAGNRAIERRVSMREGEAVQLSPHGAPINSGAYVPGAALSSLDLYSSEKQNSFQ